MRRSIGVLLALLCMGAVALPAHAVDPCTTDSTGESNPQIIDDTGDYDALVGGNGSGLPIGDVYGDSNDLVSGWISRTPTGFQVDIRTVKWDGIETNAVYNFLWTFQGNSVPPVTASRYVSATLIRPLPTPIYRFEMGYITVGTGANTITSQTTLQGTMTPGSPGRITVAVPAAKMRTFGGNPLAGDTLSAVGLESRWLTGAQGTGLLSLIDDAGGDPCSDVLIPIV